MSTGLTVRSPSTGLQVDFDDLFRPIGGAAAGPSVGFSYLGTDISQRYHASIGSDDRIAYSTGFKSADGADLSTKFQRLGFGDVTAPAITGGTITAANTAANVGGSVTFTVAASGTTPLTYTWLFKAVVIPGATSSSYTKSNLTLNDSGYYAVVVSNSAGSDSRSSQLSVTDVPPVQIGGNVSSTPPAYNLQVGSTVSLSIIVSGTNLQYQWYKGGVPISGQTSSSYAFTSTSPSQGGQYTVEVSNLAGLISASAWIALSDVTPAITGGTVTGGPYNLFVGNVVNLTVSATGTNLAYQWFKDNLPLGGATGTSYAFTSTSPSQGGTYKVTVTNGSGQVSAQTSVSISDTPVTITGGTVTGGPYNLNVGNVAGFTVTATGSNLVYWWLKDGNFIPGANSASYSFVVSSTADAGQYTVIVGNNNYSASAAANLTVNP